MTITKWLRRASVPGLLGLAAVATAGPASAQTFAYGAIVVYATQAVQSAATVMTASKTTTITELAPAGVIPATSTNITLTLPGGFTFNNTPTVSCAPGTTSTCSITATPSPVGSSSFTFTVQYSATAAGTASVISITATGAPPSAFTFTNATVLQTPTPAVLAIKAASSDPNWVVTGGASSGFAFSISALNFFAAGPTTPLFGTLVIDVGTGGLGKQFIQGAGSNPDTLLADLGGLTLGTVAGTTAADGFTAFAFGGSLTSITLAGNFNGIASAYLAPQSSNAVTTCAASAPAGSFPGVVTPTGISFASVPVATTAGTAQEVCITASGTALIGANPAAPTAKAAVGSFAPQATAFGALDLYNYNGTVQQILYSGAFATYPLFERITNNTGGTLTTVVAVQPDTGAGGVATLTPIPGNTNVLIPAGTIITGSGVALDSTSRVSLLFLTKGAISVNGGGGPNAAVSVDQFVINPNGSISVWGGGSAP